MKRIIRKETHACDKCDKEADYPDVCLNCGTEMCHECAKKHGVEYRHAVYCSGSGDGFYCKPCDAKLLSSGTDKLHRAYVAIELLRIELADESADFDRRRKEAEKALKAIPRP